MRKTDNTFAMNTGANGGDWRAEHIVCLLRDMTDPETRYSRGFAFVEMTNEFEAKKAITHFKRRDFVG